MNIDETRALVAWLESEFSDFRPNDARVLAWHTALKDSTYLEAMVAVRKIFTGEYRTKTKAPNIIELTTALKKSGREDGEAYRACLQTCKTRPHDNGTSEVYERPVWDEKNQLWKKHQYVRANKDARADWLQAQLKLRGGQVECRFTRRSGESVTMLQPREHCFNDGVRWWPRIEYIMFWIPDVSKRFMGWDIYKLVGNREEAAKYFAWREPLLDEAIEIAAREHGKNREHTGPATDRF